MKPRSAGQLHVGPLSPMTLCALAKTASVGAWVYLAWATFLIVGALFMPKGLAFQVSANRVELKDAWRRVQSRNWQSPIFALLLPVVFVFALPLTFPMVSVGSAVALLLFGSIAAC